VPGFTPIQNWPFPVDADPVDVAGDLHKMALALDPSSVPFFNSVADRNTRWPNPPEGALSTRHDKPGGGVERFSSAGHWTPVDQDWHTALVSGSYQSYGTGVGLRDIVTCNIPAKSYRSAVLFWAMAQCGSDSSAVNVVFDVLRLSDAFSLVSTGLMVSNAANVMVAAPLMSAFVLEAGIVGSIKLRANIQAGSGTFYAGSSITTLEITAEV